MLISILISIISRLLMQITQELLVSKITILVKLNSELKSDVILLKYYEVLIVNGQNAVIRALRGAKLKMAARGVPLML